MSNSFNCTAVSFKFLLLYRSLYCFNSVSPVSLFQWSLYCFLETSIASKMGASAASKGMLLLLQSTCCYCYRLYAATAEHMIKTAAKCILQSCCYFYNAIYCFYDALLFLWCSLLFLWCSIPFLWCFLLFLWCSLLFLLYTASNTVNLQLGPNNNNNKLQQPADRLLEAGKKDKMIS